jgi:hypothetical protein
MAAENTADTSGTPQRRTMNGSDRLLVPYDETMHILGDIGKTTFFDLKKTGQIEEVKIGRRGFITAKSIAAYVDRLSQGATVSLQ